MIKYRGTYKVIKEKDKNGKLSLNREDNYLLGRNKIQIYRFNNDTLCILFRSTGVANNRVKELADLGVKLIPYLMGKDEKVYKFAELDLEKVAEVVKIRKRIKRDLTEEQRNEIKERLSKYKNNILHKNN